MVAPKAESIFTNMQRVVGIRLYCPVCEDGLLGSVLRCETPNDYPPAECPDIVGKAGPMGFVARCDSCGFRVHLRGDRLPTVAMMQESHPGRSAPPLS